jgi:hypothetical protein
LLISGFVRLVEGAQADPDNVTIETKSKPMLREGCICYAATA